MIPRTCGICIAISEISSWKELKLVPSFLLSSFLLARRSYTSIKFQYAVALFPIVGNTMAQEWSQYHLRFRTYGGRKNSLLLLTYYDDD